MEYQDFQLTPNRCPKCGRLYLHSQWAEEMWRRSRRRLIVIQVILLIAVLLNVGAALLNLRALL